MAGLIQNEDIKSSAELIAAGGAASQLPNDDKIYVTANTINKTLKQAIIDGDIGASVTVNTAQTVTSGGTITYTAGKMNQVMFVGGTGGQTLLSTNPFGTGTLVDGMIFTVIGTDNTNTVEIPFNDASKGCVGDFTSIILARFQSVRFVYSATLARFVRA